MMAQFSRRTALGFLAVLGVASVFLRRWFAATDDGSIAQSSLGLVTDTKITRLAIHPAIGIARVGNSLTEYFIGPEVTDPPLTTHGSSRDRYGAIKRQAARFRIYGYNQQGQAVKEILPDSSTRIEWQVHVANKKAGWYRFLAALDIDEAKNLKSPLRNAHVQGNDRSSLIIDSGAKTISGTDQKGPELRGHFRSTSVYLGELRTDKSGRLLFLGGLGKSESPTGKPIYDEKDMDTFNNADEWYDDICDGPVSASVLVDGKPIAVDGKIFEVEAAWVTVAPPNYAPDIVGWRTMDELVPDTFIKSGEIRPPQKTYYFSDVLPILRRLSQIGWLNQGFVTAFGPSENPSADFSNSVFLASLATAPLAERERVKKIYDSFRLSSMGSNLEQNKRLWPMLYGDAYGSFDNALNANLIVPDLQALHLNRWIKGDAAEYDGTTKFKTVQTLEELPAQEQPRMLDRAALHFCLADAFHPGCELTWPMRHLTLYKQFGGRHIPFRINQKPENTPEPALDEFLTHDSVARVDGPLYGQGPGDLTKWMALPWQGDTVFCRSGYEPEFDPFIPAFWPARVPNQVLTEQSYRLITDTSVPRDQRLLEFRKNRMSWVRNMKGSAPQQMLQMVQGFGSMGIVEAKAGITGDADFPPIMFVEDVAFPATVGTAKDSPRGFPRPSPKDETDPVKKAGWESPEQLKEFRDVRFRHLRPK